MFVSSRGKNRRQISQEWEGERPVSSHLPQAHELVLGKQGPAGPPASRREHRLGTRRGLRKGHGDWQVLP